MSRKIQSHASTNPAFCLFASVFHSILNHFVLETMRFSHGRSLDSFVLTLLPDYDIITASETITEGIICVQEVVEREAKCQQVMAGQCLNPWF